MPDAELFPFPVSLSPRLAWMNLHRVEVFRGNPGGPAWFCKRAGMDHTNTIGAGDTDNDAILDFCEKSGVKHWTVTG